MAPRIQYAKTADGVSIAQGLEAPVRLYEVRWLENV